MERRMEPALTPRYANSSIGSLKPRTGYSPTRSSSNSPATRSANARDSSTGLPNLLGQGFQPRGHVDRGADHGEVEPGARADIAVHDVADMDSDAEVQRLAARSRAFSSFSAAMA